MENNWKWIGESSAMFINPKTNMAVGHVKWYSERLYVAKVLKPDFKWSDELFFTTEESAKKFVEDYFKMTWG